MVANIQTIAFQGVEAVAVEVQVHLAPGQNAFNVVGLPDKSVAESRERMRAALSAIGLALPYDRITINLSPADLPKEGSHYDVPIALGLLVAMRALPQQAVNGFCVMGEFGLDGTLIGVPGALPAAMSAMAKHQGLICLADCGPEAAWSGLAAPDARGRKLLDQIIDDGGLTARGFNRILRVARSLADLAGRDGLTDKDIATALVWRGHS